MENIILVDYDTPSDWDFKKGLEERTGLFWNVLKCVSNQDHGGVKKLKRYMKYFWLPFKVFKKRRNYKTIVAWQQFFGIILAIYFRIFHVNVDKAPAIYIMELIYLPRKGILGKVYRAFVAYGVRANYVKAIFVFSNNEKERYADELGIEASKMFVLQLGIEDEYERFEKEITDEGFYVAAGRSNRDYQFLINNWPYDKKLFIITESLPVQNDRGNIELVSNCYNDDYLSYVAKCHAVIVPLENEEVSSGQLVVLQAMMLGKPVIVSENICIREYIASNKNGIIIKKNKEELLKAIRELDDLESYIEYTKCARQTFRQGFSVKIMGDSVGSVINGMQRDELQRGVKCD